jgi:acyl-CoA synthetase (AMP-forming)/AMP-acid ligase II
MFRSTSGPIRETTLPNQQILLQKQSVGEIVDFWAEIHPDHPAMTFLDDRGGTTTRSYGDLRGEALRIAVRLEEVCRAGDRVILLFPPGTDFVAAFLGCLYAGVLAVPATEPKPRRLNDRLSVVAADCEPAAVLCSAEVAERIEVAVVCPALAQLP